MVPVGGTDTHPATVAPNASKITPSARNWSILLALRFPRMIASSASGPRIMPNGSPRQGIYGLGEPGYTPHVRKRPVTGS